MIFTIFRVDGTARQTVSAVDGEDPEVTVELYLDDGESYLEGDFLTEPLPIEQTDEVVALDLMKALDLIRAERDRRLDACDWTQMPDAPLTNERRQAWRDYRQALRDFTDTVDPANPVWPEPPQK